MWDCIKRYLCTVRHFQNKHVFEGTQKKVFRELYEKSRYQLKERRRGRYGANERLASQGESCRIKRGNARKMPDVKKERVPRKREGPRRNERGPCVPPLSSDPLSPYQEACVACPISHSSSIDTYNTDTTAAANRMYQHIRKRPCMCVCKWFCCSWWRVHLMEDTAWLSCKREKEWKRGWSARLGGWRRGLPCVSEMHARARGGVLAATRVVEREISRKREETKKREVTSPQGP